MHVLNLFSFSFVFYKLKLLMPHGLDLEPDVKDVLDVFEELLPSQDTLLERLGEGRPFHRLSLDDVVINEHLHLVHCRTGQDERSSLAPRIENAYNRFPFRELGVEAFLDRILLRRVF